MQIVLCGLTWTQDVQEWVSTCLEYQKCKVHQHINSSVNTFSNLNAHFSHIHFDLFGPLPMCQHYQYLLTVVDCFSQWPTAVPIKNISASTVSKAILKDMIVIFGIPQMITADSGTQFQSFLFWEFTHLLCIKYIKTTGYHLCTNGLIERFPPISKNFPGHQTWHNQLGWWPTSDFSLYNKHP